jgi:O-antigen ligase
LILLMPIAPSVIFPHAMFGITGLNPLNVLLVGTLVSYFMHRIAGAKTKRGARFMPRPLWWLYVVPFVVAGAMGAPHVSDIPGFMMTPDMSSFFDSMGYVRDVVAKPLFLVVFALLVAAATAEADKVERFVAPMVGAIWIMGLMTVIYFIVTGVSLGDIAGAQSRQFLGPLGLHANDLGRLYAIAYALLLFMWAATPDYRLKIILLASMGMIVLALLLTFSRGAFVGFIVVNVLFLFSRRSPAAYVFAFLLLLLVIPLTPGAVVYRIEEGWGSGDVDAITAGRVDGIWLPLLPELARSPLIGNGLSSILWSDAMRAGKILEVTHPHNAYFGVLLDMGILGLALVCAFFFHVWRSFRKLAKDAALSAELRGLYAGAAAGLVGFLIAGFAGSALTPVPEQVFLWFAIGMMYGQFARATKALR